MKAGDTKCRQPGAQQAAPSQLPHPQHFAKIQEVGENPTVKWGDGVGVPLGINI